MNFCLILTSDIIKKNIKIVKNGTDDPGLLKRSSRMVLI